MFGESKIVEPSLYEATLNLLGYSALAGSAITVLAYQGDPIEQLGFIALALNTLGMMCWVLSERSVRGRLERTLLKVNE